MAGAEESFNITLEVDWSFKYRSTSSTPSDQEYVEESLSSPTFLFALSQIASNLVHSMVITKS
jgi:hypothetical protein